MTKYLLLSMAMCILAIGGVSEGSYIEYINGTNIATAFNAATGELTLNETIVLIYVRDVPPQGFEPYAQFSLTTYLVQDNSTAILADGVFGGGTFSILDQSSAVLLSGSVSELNLSGVVGSDRMAGAGVFTLDAGSLLAEIRPGYDKALVWNLQFELNPLVSDFQTSYTGKTDINIKPIPEPATLAVLGLGGLLIFRKRR